MRGKNFSGFIGLAALCLCFIGCGPKKELPFLTDHSKPNFYLVSDGVHPWLTINLLHDPTDTNSCPLRWSPNGRTLVYLDGDILYTWNSSGAFQLLGGKNWSDPMWSPDGQFIVVSSPQKTVVIDSTSMRIHQQFDGEQIVWWAGDKLCNTKRIFACDRKASDVQVFTCGDEDLKLPAGLTLVSAAPDGAVLLAQSNYLGTSAENASFSLIGMDRSRRAIMWIKPAANLATKNYSAPELHWNEQMQMTAQTADAGGGYDFHGFVETGRNTVELKFATDANYTWISGGLNWMGDQLFVPATLARVAQTSSSEVNLKFWNVLAFYSPSKGTMRSISTGLPFEAAAASDNYVAMIMQDNGQPKIVIATWTKDPQGNITGISYVPVHSKPTQLV